MPRDLKEPAGCRFSSLRKMRQPAALERAADSTRGVRIQGVGISVGGGVGRESIICREGGGGASGGN